MANKRYLWLIIAVGAVGFISGTAGSTETNMYHTNRTFTPVPIHVPDNPTVDQLYNEVMKLTDIVAAGTNITINSNETYAIEKQSVVLGAASAEEAWDELLAYAATNTMELDYAGKIYNNVGWVRGTKLAGGKWGAYFHMLRNRIAFKSSETNWWRSPSNGVPVAIAKVMVGTLGDYAPMEDVVDVGPSLDAATNNFPGENTGEDKIFRADITNVYYQFIIPFIWITPRGTYAAAGGSNVQYTVTGTNISNGVTWTISPSGLSGGATIQPSNDWHYAGVTPGTVATNYKVRATSVDNTNFHDEVNLTILKSDIAETNVYVAVSNTTTLHLTPDSSTNVQWEIVPNLQDGASIDGISVGTNIVINAGSVPTNYTVRAYAVNYTNCNDTCTVTVLSMAVTNIKFNWDTGSSVNDAINIRQDFNTSHDISNGEWVKGGTNIPVCYTTNKAVTIKARFVVQPASITSAVIWATSTVSGGSLSNVIKTNVTFSGGMSSPEYVMFQIDGTTPNCVKKTAVDAWQWKIENVNASGSTTNNVNTSGAYTIYTILNEPVSPWDNSWLGGNNPSNAWVSVLDFVCLESPWAGGTTTIPDAAAKITQQIYNSGRFTYDSTGGACNYTRIALDYFDLTSWIERLNGGTGRGESVNCWDCANGVVSMCNVLGCDIWNQWMGWNFQCNEIRAIKDGTWGRPFPPPLGSNGFSYHRVGWRGAVANAGKVFDACLKVDNDGNPTGTGNHNSELIATDMTFWTGSGSFDDYKQMLVDTNSYGNCDVSNTPGSGQDPGQRRDPIQ